MDSPWSGAAMAFRHRGSENEDGRLAWSMAGQVDFKLLS